jgi:tRNA(fMet)-specific endonuclease VapC
MTYLIDSDWVASFLRGRPEARTLFQALAPDGRAISLITYGEVYEGIYYGQNPAQNERIFRQFLRGVTVLPLNRQIMERFARIRGDLRRRGQIIGDTDVLIAATALHHHLTLVTRHRDHFQRILGLTLGFLASRSIANRSCRRHNADRCV